MYADKASNRRSVGRQTRDVLRRVLDERSPALGEHHGAVAHLAEEVARRFDLDPGSIDAIRHAAELHDVGKVAIPDSILLRPGPLDVHEWAFVERHTLIGERIIAAAPALSHVAALVRSSAERWDGTGYPDGLAGTGIPLGARIVAVCDAFETMTADSPYGRARSEWEALAELRRCSGTQFDPAVVEALSAVRSGAPSSLQPVP
jgi:HD-GYP domain-containing protein (c-di-GMP phosphodiesterase class II)